MMDSMDALEEPITPVLCSSLSQSSRAAATSRLTTLARVFGNLSIKKQSNETPEDVRGPLGLRLLFDSAEPLADIIFVHGLGGGSRKTWDKDNDPALYWPREWLSRDPEFRHVRAHTFGYPADWMDRRESVLGINDFANSLLSQLQASATIRRAKQLPLIFVCHSMGGLVVKKAFILSQHDPNFQELGKRFDTIYFLGTPHHGASSAQLITAILKASNSRNKPFVNDLKLESPAIQAINDEFRHYPSRVQLYSFFEAEPTSILELGGVFIVTKASGIMNLPNERVSPLQADHRGVCKYNSPSDPNYIVVRNSIVEALDRIRIAWNTANDGAMKTRKRNLKNFLHISDQLWQFHVDFDEPRVEGSCEWLSNIPSFRRWCDASEPRMFWLYGNPGTGKSFLAKYVIDHVAGLGFDCSYFFFRAGDKKQSPLKSCLLSLAWQMAESSVFIRDIFLEMYESGSEFDQENFQSIWRTLFVGGIFQTKLVKPHFWVLDGLDECANYGELFPLLAKISSALSLQIFVSSRPSIDMHTGITWYGPEAAMYTVTQESTSADIQRYIENHVDLFSIQKPSERQTLMSIILNKSEGSFLWVKLVLKELRNALSEEAIKRVLKNIPKGMDQIYLRSLEPLSKEEMRRPVAKTILMWASTCIRPLEVAELKAALVIHINQTFNSLERHIGWLCGCLVTVDACSLVKVVHETARSFILNPESGSPVAFREAEAHKELAIVCLKYLNEKELKAPRGRRSNAVQAGTIARSPFIRYAVLAWHEHMEKSQSTSEEMVELLYNFCSSTSGNILTWIEYVVSANSNLSTLTRAGVLMRSFAARVGKTRQQQTERLDHIKAWSTDLIRVAAKFGRNLLRLPASIYTTVPPFCPRNSAIYRQYGHSKRGVGVLGVNSLLDWDDCLATIVYKQKGSRAMSLAAASNYFAVGMSNSFVRLYHTSTCQEFFAFHHEESVKVVEFSVAGQWMATSGNRRLCVWDVPAKRIAWEHELTRPCISMTFDAENDELVVACQDNQLRYFSIESGHLNDEIPWFMDEGHVRTITNVPVAAALSFQHQLFAFVYRGSHIGLWNWETDEFLGFCEKPDARLRICPFHATSLVFSPVPNSNSLAAAYEQGEIVVFDPIECSIKASYKCDTDNQTLACSLDGRTLIAGDSAGVIRIFDFQRFDTPGLNQKLRLLNVISGLEENIASLAFCDDRRFVDIRGPKVKVWEPTILVRQDSGGDTESITSDCISVFDPVAEENDPITSLSVHPNGKHIFCATHAGLINVYDTAAGSCTQTLYEHFRGDTILWMIFSKADDILASAGVSSRVFIHRLAYESQWTIEKKLSEYRMGERIEQLMFNSTGTKILVVTTTRDMVYSLMDNSTASASWDTRLPGFWCNDPRDPERLLLWVNRKLRVFLWEGLQEITPPSGINLDFDLPTGFGIQNVYSGWKGNYIVTLYSGIDHAWSACRLLIWDAADFSIQ
ncbi:GPI inositol-deacylase [Madurella fahalii]|uniref:GPI inositol-deacylase n=1 Tax=Madurella fahalii TaxID=1157608 RepID=A0ABQ0GJA4_9PEZI